MVIPTADSPVAVYTIHVSLRPARASGAHLRPWASRGSAAWGGTPYVRQPGHDDPNHQICLRCNKKRGNSFFYPNLG